MIKLNDAIKIFPMILFSISRKRASAQLEYNVSSSRMRNALAFSLVLPFCLMIDRFGLYRPTFLQYISPAWTALLTTGIFYLFVILRSLIYKLFRPRRLGGLYEAALSKGSYGLFAIMVVLMLPTVAIMLLVGASDALIAKILLYEIAISFIYLLIRVAHILQLNYSALAIFLYLCALELAPAAMLVASARLL